jgi:hypothetical protein
MLHFITSITDRLIEYIKDDPVRPEIPADFRVTNGRMVAALTDNERNPEAIVCISFHDFVPEDVAELETVSDVPTTVVFYSIWSYNRGSGRELLLQTLKNIKKDYPTVTIFVTLSPPTEMARHFHLKNGATVYRTNRETINYLYS